MRYTLVALLLMCPVTVHAQFTAPERIASALEDANRARELARWEDQNDKWLAEEQARVSQMNTVAMQQEILRLRGLVNQMESDRIQVLQAVATGDDAWIKDWLNSLSKAIRTRKKYTFEVQAALARP